MQFHSRLTINPIGKLMNLSTLEQVIEHSLITVSPETSLIDVVVMMSQASGPQSESSHPDSSIDTRFQGQASSSCVLVTDGSQLVGIFTERDVVKFAASETKLSELKISEAMTQPVITMTLSDSATTLSALELFHQHRIRHLPVLDDREQLVGMITLNNIHQMVLLQLQAAYDQQFQIQIWPSDKVSKRTRFLPREHHYGVNAGEFWSIARLSESCDSPNARPSKSQQCHSI